MPDHPCPGCGARFPGPAPGQVQVQVATYRASPECVADYHELSALILDNAAAAGQWHQLGTDTYAAQHVGPRMRPITLWFALVGLHLALDRGLTGPQVRDAHQYLSSRGGDWPRFAAPDSPGSLTAHDVPRDLDGGALSAGLVAWAEAVWQVWQPVHEAVATTCLQALAAWYPGRIR